MSTVTENMISELGSLFENLKEKYFQFGMHLHRCNDDFYLTDEFTPATHYMMNFKSYTVKEFKIPVVYNGKTYNMGKFIRPDSEYNYSGSHYHSFEFQSLFGFGCHISGFTDKRTVLICDQKPNVSFKELGEIIRNQPIDKDLTWFLLKYLFFGGILNIGREQYCLDTITQQLVDIGFESVENPSKLVKLGNDPYNGSFADLL